MRTWPRRRGELSSPVLGNAPHVRFGSNAVLRNDQRERPLDDFLKHRFIESAADSIGFSVIFAVVSMHKVDRAGNNRSRSNHRAVPHRSSDHGVEADFRAAYARADLQRVPPGQGR